MTLLGDGPAPHALRPSGRRVEKAPVVLPALFGSPDDALVTIHRGASLPSAEVLAVSRAEASALALCPTPLLTGEAAVLFRTS